MLHDKKKFKIATYNITHIVMVLNILLSTNIAKAEQQINQYASFGEEIEHTPATSNYLNANTAIFDPFEPFNRKVFTFNSVVNEMLIFPTVSLYNFAIPQFGKNRVDHFLLNLRTPLYFVNHVLQGNSQFSFVSFWRFMLNTTLGVGGLFDIASTLGLNPIRTDFGITLATYKVGMGPYLVLPLLGPSSARDFFGSGVDYVIDPMNLKIRGQKFTKKQKLWRAGAEYVNTYSKFADTIKEIENNSLDPYLTFRSFYIQSREAKHEHSH
jgi:phospholipid-binding lipoprotein MlaA